MTARKQTGKTTQSPPRRGLEAEVMKALGKLSKSIERPSDLEIMRVAALHVVQTKLAEVSQLLAAFAPEERLAVSSPRSPVRSREPVTHEGIARQIEAADAGVVRAAATADPCQWCGEPGVYKTNRGMVLCGAHRSMGVVDDQNDKIESMLNMGYGRRTGEVIHVSADGAS